MLICAYGYAYACPVCRMLNFVHSYVHPRVYAVLTTVCVRYMQMCVNVMCVFSYIPASGFCVVMCGRMCISVCCMCASVQVGMHSGTHACRCTAKYVYTVIYVYMVLYM